MDNALMLRTEGKNILWEMLMNLYPDILISQERLAIVLEDTVEKLVEKLT